MKKWMLTAVVLFCAIGTSLSWSQEALFANEIAGSSSIILSSDSFLPVEDVYQVAVNVEDDYLVFNWSIQPKYYLYRDRFKFNAVDATTQLSPPLFETGKRKYDEFFEEELEVYYLQTSVRVPFQSNQKKIDIQIESQGCADAGLCYPPYTQWLTIDTISEAVTISDTPSATAQAALQGRSPGQETKELSLFWILGFALIGGMILNLMPCVFPVLSIKALSFTMSHQTQREKQAHGLAYTLGVTSTFVAIAIVMLSLRAAGEAIGWGFQLQSPIFVVGLIYLFFIMGLAFSGYFEIGTSLMSLGQGSTATNSLPSSFMTGVLATTVASPCTAPFMGPALGFAISQPTYIALLVFAFLGLGMALPFIALTWIPGLSSKMPKPGAWMDAFKQFLAFPLYITAVWLIWVVGRQTSIDVAAIVILGVILLGMTIWLTKLRQSTGKKITDITFTNLFAAVCLIGALVAPIMSISKDAEPPRWETYTPQRLTELRQSGAPVFINLTADWCITCLANERVAFTDKFYQSLRDNQITYLKGDWTNNDPKITKLLNEFQRSGVPLYLLYPENQGQPKVLPQILLESTVIDALNAAKT